MRRPSFGGMRITTACAWILAVFTATFLFVVFLSEENRTAVLAWIGLRPADLARFHVWKLGSATVIPESGWAFFFNALMLWLFLPALEQWWGQRRFVTFFAVTSIFANLCGAIVGLLLGGGWRLIEMHGMTPFLYAGIAAYGVLFANRPVQFFGILPIKGKHLAIGMAAVVALFVLIEQNWVEGTRYFSAMGLAWVMTSGVWTPNLWWLRVRRWRLHKKYKVLDGGKSRKNGDQRWMN